MDFRGGALQSHADTDDEVMMMKMMSMVRMMMMMMMMMMIAVKIIAAKTSFFKFPYFGELEVRNSS